MTQRGFALTGLAYVFGALAIMAMLGTAAYKLRESGKDAVRLEWNEAIAQQREEDIQRSVLAASSLSKDRVKARTIIQERTVYVDRHIEKLVDSGRCFADLGVQCLNAAIKGESAAGQCADGALPKPKPAG